MDLLSKKCTACEGETPPMPQKEAETYLADTPGWELAPENSCIRKTFTWKDFKESMSFVNQVAALAESEGHHPDLHIVWNKVTLDLTTHAIRGLSKNDFIMAAKINALL